MLREIDYNDVEMWKNNPELVLRTATRYAYKWGHWYEDKEDLQMHIVEAILLAINKFDPMKVTQESRGINLFVWLAGKRAVMEYGRKYGRHFKGRDKANRVYIRDFEYHEMDEADAAEKKGYRQLEHARFVGAHWDDHSDDNLIEDLKHESEQIRKIVFCFYFLEMTAVEIAEELGVSEAWVNQKIADYKHRYRKRNYQDDNEKSSSSSQEDSAIEKLEDFYELVLKQSNLTQSTSSEN